MIRAKISKSSLADQADKALKSAIRKLIAERKRAGGVLVVWRNGKVARIPARKIRS